MSQSLNNLGIGYDTFQYFGANATRSTILKNWITKIETEKDKTPIGLVFVQLNATTIEGRFVFEGDDTTGKMMRKLTWAGKNSASMCFLLPKFFAEFVRGLPINNRTNHRKYPKVYCKMELSMDLEFIQWYVDDDFVYESYHYLKTLKQNYQTYLLKKINMVLSKMERFSALSYEEQKGYNFEVMNNMIIDLKARSPLLQYLDLYEV